MVEINPNDYEQVNFFDLPESNEVKDFKSVGLDIAVIVSLKDDSEGKKSDLYFKSWHNIVNRAKELNAQFIRLRHFPVNILDDANFLYFLRAGIIPILSYYLRVIVLNYDR